MVIRQQIEDLRSQQGQLTDTQQQYSLPIRTVSELTLPPSYEQLIGSEEGSDLPPPSYEEAIVSMSKESTKSDNIIVLNYSVKWLCEYILIVEVYDGNNYIINNNIFSTLDNGYIFLENNI